MPPKGSKAKHNKGKFIGQYIKNKKTMSLMRQQLDEQNEELDKISHMLSRKEEKIKIQKNSTPDSKLSKRRRQNNPTSKHLHLRNKIRRRNETISVCNDIHGGSKENQDPTIDGMLDTLTAKCKSDKLACKILSSKPALVNTITKKCEEKFMVDQKKIKIQPLMEC